MMPAITTMAILTGWAIRTRLRMRLRILDPAPGWTITLRHPVV